MQTQDFERRFALDLIAARANRQHLAPVVDERFDQISAYRIARRVRDAQVAAGALPIGRKIGFTNRSIWPEYGVFEPIWAHVYDTTVAYQHGTDASVSLARFVEPRLEPEIILHFSATPPVAATPAQLVAAIDWIAHGFEIVDSPFPSWRFSVADTVAAFSLHGCLIIGPPLPIERFGATPEEVIATLSGLRIELACNDLPRDAGVGANVLDGPIQACAHLSRLLVDQPAFAPLTAGEVVTTGTLTRAWPIRAGERWSTQFNGVALAGLQLTVR